MADNGTLTARKRRFVNELKTASTVRGAAQTIGLPERTAWRYLSDPAVKAELTRHSDAQLAEVTRRLAVAMGKALDVLIELMETPGASAIRGAGVRLGAARSALDSGLRMAELVNLADRVNALEQRMENDE